MPYTPSGQPKTNSFDAGAALISPQAASTGTITSRPVRSWSTVPTPTTFPARTAMISPI